MQTPEQPISPENLPEAKPGLRQRMRERLGLKPEYSRQRRRLSMLLGGFLLLGLAFFIYIKASLPSFTELENPAANMATQVFSADGKVLGSFYLTENRIYIGQDDVPDNLRDALIATEDKRFLEHSGIDMFGVFNMLTSPFTGKVRGGSTITQQLARNLYIEQVGLDRSPIRKLKEMVASVYLEQRYTKREIMMHYLNTVPWGGVLYGVQSAAMHYYGKDTKELLPEESAMLVAMLRAPSAMNPRRYPERAMRVRNTVLALMAQQGKLTEVQADSLQEIPLKMTAERKQMHNEGLAPYFREHLRQWLQQWCAQCRAKVNRYGKKECPDMHIDGLRIYTTIDSRLQQHAENAMREHMKNLQKDMDKELTGNEPWLRDSSIISRAVRQSARYNTLALAGKKQKEILAVFNQKTQMRLFSWNGAGYIDTLMSPLDSIKYYLRYLEPGLVSIDPSNGGILAWVGGIDHQYFQYDHVMKAKRQVGSTFKTFVYTAAFDNGYSPCEEVSNERFTYVDKETGEEWTPRNASDEYGGNMTMRQGLALSVNVITARVVTQYTTPLAVKHYAKKMGIESDFEAVPALSLGTFDMTLSELTSAYTTIAGNGIWHKPMFVTRIEDKDGNVLEQFTPAGEEAISPETAYLMVDMLRAVVNQGTAGSLRWKWKVPWDMDIAGKTGTTQNHSDGWYIGFTPQICTGVWVGCSDRSVHFQTLAKGSGGNTALPVWGLYMRNAYADTTLGLDIRRRFLPPASLKVETNCEKFKEKKARSAEQKKTERAGLNDFDD